jgi:hypothetical protein
MTRPTEPNPGSSEAVERRCTCPVVDNHYGKGMPYRGEWEWWINGGCPLHGAAPCEGEE